MQHPGVWTPLTKELHYFDVVHLGFGANIQLNVLRHALSGLKPETHTQEQQAYYKKIVDENFCFTDAWYQHIFSAAPAGQLKGETTPFYSSLPVEGIRHIQRLAPGVKIIYLIRDPADRAVSSLKMALSQNPELPQVQFCRSKRFISRGDYQNNITHWESCFDAEDILYIPYGRIRSRPSDVLKAVECFLGIANFQGYTNPSQPIRRGKQSGLDQAALDIIFREAAVQRQFLENRFGSDFLYETR